MPFTTVAATHEMLATFADPGFNDTPPPNIGSLSLIQKNIRGPAKGKPAINTRILESSFWPGANAGHAAF
jgi:hypothetical protein